MLLFLVLIAGCSKERRIHPYKNDFSTVGLWVSEDGRATYNIKNLDYAGTGEKYYEYYQNDERYLRRYFNGITEAWVITRITNDQLFLTNIRGTSISFWRAD